MTLWNLCSLQAKLCKLWQHFWKPTLWIYAYDHSKKFSQNCQSRTGWYEDIKNRILDFHNIINYLSEVSHYSHGQPLPSSPSQVANPSLSLQKIQDSINTQLLFSMYTDFMSSICSVALVLWAISQYLKDIDKSSTFKNLSKATVLSKPVPDKMLSLTNVISITFLFIKR